VQDSTPLHAMSLAASQDFTRETVAPHCASCERRRKEEPHYHLRLRLFAGKLFPFGK